MNFKTLELDVTSRCNLACRYCYKSEKDGPSTGRDMPFAVASKALRWFMRQARERRVTVNFMGAEPLLNVDLIEGVMDYGTKLAKAKGISIAFGGATNATLIDERVVGLLKRGLRLNLSLDGCPAAHDACRVFPNGAGSSRAAFAGAHRYLAAKAGEARMTVSPQTARLLPESVTHLRTLVSQIAVEPDYSADWTPAAIEELSRAWRKVGELYILAFAAGRPFYLSALDKAIKALRRLRRGDAPCGAGRGLVSVDIDGRFFPCHRFVGIEEFVAGDISSGIDEGPLETFRKYSSRFDAAPQERACSDCPAVFICKGGCPAANYAATGDTRAPGPAFCRIQMIIAREATRALYLLSHDPDSESTFRRHFKVGGRGGPVGSSKCAEC